MDDIVGLKLLGILEQMSQEKGVPMHKDLVNKNIIKSEGSTFESDQKKSKLSSLDKENIKEASGLFSEIFLDQQSKLAKIQKPVPKQSELMKEFLNEKLLQNQKQKIVNNSSSKTENIVNNSSSKTENIINNSSSKTENIINNANKIDETLLKGIIKEVSKPSISEQRPTLEKNRRTQQPISLNDLYLKKQYKTFIEMFFEYSKKNKEDTKEKTSFSKITKSAAPPPLPRKTPQKSESSLFSTIALASISALVGLAGFLYGMFTDGPLKGLSKILSKIGFKGALSLMEKAMMKFVSFVKNFFKFPLSMIEDLSKGGIGLIKKILPKGMKGIFGKITGGILKVLKPAAKLLKRVPIIGTLISLGFAISRFSSGDTVGGVIDVLSGLVGLLDMVVPGLGFGLSLGLDVLNAFLDVKTGGSNAETSPKKLDILKTMGLTVGKWIWDHALYIPVLGSVKRLGMAWEAFSSGNLGEGLKQMMLGIVSITPGAGALIEGFQVLHGWLTSNKQEETNFSSNKSWMNKIKDWISSKLKELPWPIKKALSFFGIVEDDTPSTNGVFSGIESAAKDSFNSVRGLVSGAWDKMKGPISESLFSLSSYASDIWDKTKDFASDSWTKTKDIMANVWDDTTSLLETTWGTMKEQGPILLEKTKQIGESAMEKASDSMIWIKDRFVNTLISVKDKVSEWMPKIVDSITTITESSLGFIKNLVSKIGYWIGEFVLPEKNTPLKDKEVSKSQSKEEIVENTVIYSKISMEQNYDQTLQLKVLYSSSLKQIDLLSNISNILNSSLHELKRMNNSGGGSTIQSINVPPSQSKTQSVNINNNRGGYMSSPYSLQ